ncbi:cysteine hydrolase family protein [Amycolatopsis alkalitolerans]|uniref:Cysteine hydrolase n=1 Tax=Amycolatopsis alkalitolerans TaxID=2547244 RepID=A0A5C4M7N7_9PSEU|nr:isochorismatase family cysteine hydrolase [Amycolatopsis alkalitolerans]TNC27730.1 cysteine hydrolase [Amycolatopsis alkalitolerans]
MRNALIVGELQAGILENYPFARTLVPPLTGLLPRARAAGVLVVFVHTALRSNGADLTPVSQPAFDQPGGIFHEGSPGTEIALEVAEGDVVVLKRRTSAFAGTDLDLVLRANGVGSLALTGLATSAMVAATLYDASDRGYELTVLRDGCADPDPKVHGLLVETVFPSRGAEILTCAEWPAPSRTSGGRTAPR